MQIIVHICLPTSPQGEQRRACLVLETSFLRTVVLKKAFYVGEAHHSCSHACDVSYPSPGEEGDCKHCRLLDALGADQLYVASLGNGPLDGEIPSS